MNKNTSGNDIDFVEKYLNTTLQPVHPRQEFVTHLRNRMTQPAMKTSSEISPVGLLLTVLIGIVCSLLVIIGVVRAVVYLRQAYRIAGQPVDDRPVSPEK